MKIFIILLLVAVVATKPKHCQGHDSGSGSSEEGLSSSTDASSVSTSSDPPQVNNGALNADKNGTSQKIPEIKGKNGPVGTTKAKESAAKGTQKATPKVTSKPTQKGAKVTTAKTTQKVKKNRRSADDQKTTGEYESKEGDKRSP